MSRFKDLIHEIHRRSLWQVLLIYSRPDLGVCRSRATVALDIRGHKRIQRGPVARINACRELTHERLVSFKLLLP